MGNSVDRLTDVLGRDNNNNIMGNEWDEEVSEVQ